MHNKLRPNTRNRSRYRLVALAALLVALLVATLGPGQPPPARATSTTYLDETFTDNANNWNPAAGNWGINGSSHYTNCPPGGSCDNTGIDRSWIGVASDASSYTIESDIWMMGSSQECKLIFTGANNNDDYRVDIMHETDQVRVSAAYPSNTQTWTPDGVTHAPINDGGAYYHLKIAVSQSNVTVWYKQGSEPLDQILSISTSIYPDGKVGLGTYAADCEFANFTVTGNQGVGNGTARLIPLFGYERTEACNEGPSNPNRPGEELTEQECNRPLFVPWNRDEQAWWEDQVEELDHANIGTVAAENRGCWDSTSTQMHGSGDMCPNQLSNLVTALSDQSSPMKVAMFDDFPTAGDQYQTQNGTAWDVGNSSTWQTYMWDDRWNLFFKNIPSSLLATYNSRPMIFIWGPDSNETDLQGNLSRMIDWLRSQVETTYGFNPFISVEDTFYNADTTLSGHVDGIFSWYSPPTAATLPAASYNGITEATVVPGFRRVQTDPGCGSSCLEISRNHGNTLISGLDAQKNTNLVLLEGWTNVVESAGYYRSVEGNDPHGCTLATDQNTMDYANEDLNIVQRYADPNRTSVILQAAAADDYYTGSSGNQGGEYRVTSPANSGCASTYNDLSVGQVAGTYSYFVGWVNPGVEWFGFKDVYLPANTYHLVVTYATPNTEAEVCVQANGATPLCSGPLTPTGSWTTFTQVDLGTIPLHTGLSNFKITIPDAYGNPGGEQLNIENLTIHT